MDNIRINNGQNNDAHVQQNERVVQATQIHFFKTLSIEQQKSSGTYYNKNCCCIQGIMNLISNLLIFGILILFLVLFQLFTLTKNNQNYLYFQKDICDSEMLTNNNKNRYTKNSFTILRCDYGSYEDGLLKSITVFIIIFILFEIFSCLFHQKVINIKMDEEGILYYIFVSFNAFYYFFIPIFSIFSFYLIFYTSIVQYDILFEFNNNSTVNENKTDSSYNYTDYSNSTSIFSNNNGLLFIHDFSFVLVFILFIFLRKKNEKVFFLYLNFSFENENLTNLEYVNSVFKKTHMYIKNKKIDILVMANYNLFLEDKETKKYYKFKKGEIVGLNQHIDIYILQENKAIANIFSIIDWKYPAFSEAFTLLSKILKILIIIFGASLPLFKMHLNDESKYLAYTELKRLIKNKKLSFFNSFFNAYGNVESAVTTLRFVFNIIATVIILLIMLKIIFLGGSKRSISLLILWVISIIFVLQNLFINLILTLILVIFPVFSLISFYHDYVRDNYYFSNSNALQLKIFFQMIINFIIFISSFPLFYYNIILTRLLNKIRFELYKLNNYPLASNGTPIIAFQYTGLNKTQYLIKELKIDGCPRYLFYTMSNNNNLPQNINNNGNGINAIDNKISNDNNKNDENNKSKDNTINNNESVKEYLKDKKIKKIDLNEIKTCLDVEEDPKIINTEKNELNQKI